MMGLIIFGVIVFSLIFILILKFILDLKVKKIKRRYNAEEDKSKPTGKFGDGIRKHKEDIGTDRTEQSLNSDDEPKGGFLLPDDDSIVDGETNRSDDGIREDKKTSRRLFKRRGK